MRRCDINAKTGMASKSRIHSHCLQPNPEGQDDTFETVPLVIIILPVYHRALTNSASHSILDSSRERVSLR
jgi:hypothetical protein